jgi:intracellular multiplication protein IcmL
MAEKTTALKNVLLRNAFYRDGYKRVLFAVLLILFFDIALAFAIFYKYIHPPEPQYFATTPAGKIIHYHPLTDPVLSDQEILQWVSVAVRRMYELDFLHWRDQLQRIQNYFTPKGWQDWSAALKSSDNLNTISKLKMVSSGDITGAPTITQKAIIGGHYAWKVQVPVKVSYESSSRAPITQTYNITLIVLRQPVQSTPARIAINNFIPSVVGS